MKNNILLFVLVSVLVTELFSSCKHDIPQPLIILNNGNNGIGNGNVSLPPCNSDSIYFDEQIAPILVSNCTTQGCHNSISHIEGIDLSSYAAVMASDVVNPFHASSSNLVKSIVTNNPGDVMPPSPSAHLLIAQVDLIKNWINQGALNLHCDAGCDTTYVTYSGIIAPLMTNYCNGCHGGVSPSGGINLMSYADVAVFAANGSLYGCVSHDPFWSPMPKNSTMMPQCKIDQIRIWVNAGAPQN